MFESVCVCVMCIYVYVGTRMCMSVSWGCVVDM